MIRRDKTTPRAGRETSQRQLKMGEHIRHILSEATLREELIDSRGLPLTLTFTEVKCSPDLRLAKAYYVPLGDVPIEDCEFALKAASVELQAAVAKKNSAKYTPRLSYVFDTSFDQADHMRELLDSLPESQVS